MTTLDDLDTAILLELERDSRTPITELARRLGNPVSTIRDRIRRLEKEEVILGYRAVLNPEKLGYGIKAIIQVRRDQEVPLDEVIAEATQLPEIVDIKFLSGDIDELLTIHVRDVEHLRDFLYNKMISLPGMQRTSTAIVLYEVSVPFAHQVFGPSNATDCKPQP